MIFLAEPNLTGNERNYLNACIDTTFVSSVGAFVSRIEEDITRIAGANYGTAVSSGTAGLHMALTACGVQRDEMVCIPSFTFIATANAVAHCGASPWLIDITSESWTMNPELLARELAEKTVRNDGQTLHKESGRRIAAIMPVYTMGMPADMKAFREIADRYEIPLIADAAAAIGATYNNGSIGNLADATVFSFNGNKTITCGGGGAVVGPKKEIIDRVKHLSTTARCGIDYDHDMIGYNNRMTNIQAAVGCAQLERVDEFVKTKREIAAFYKRQMGNQPDISFFPEVEWAQSACWFSGILVSEKYEVKELCKKLKEQKIEARTFWKPVHLQKPYQDAEQSDMTISDSIWRRILTLPSSTGITKEQLDYVVLVVKDIL